MCSMGWDLPCSLPVLPMTTAEAIQAFQLGEQRSFG